MSTAHSIQICFANNRNSKRSLLACYSIVYRALLIINLKHCTRLWCCGDNLHDKVVPLAYCLNITPWGIAVFFCAVLCEKTKNKKRNQNCVEKSPHWGDIAQSMCLCFVYASANIQSFFRGKRKPGPRNPCLKLSWLHFW